MFIFRWCKVMKICHFEKKLTASEKCSIFWLWFPCKECFFAIWNACRCSKWSCLIQIGLYLQSGPLVTIISQALDEPHIFPSVFPLSHLLFPSFAHYMVEGQKNMSTFCGSWNPYHSFQWYIPGHFSPGRQGGQLPPTFADFRPKSFIFALNFPFLPPTFGIICSLAPPLSDSWEKPCIHRYVLFMQQILKMTTLLILFY